jgi:hypothetical protein
VSCVQIVADKGDALLPVQCLVHVEDDVEFCQRTRYLDLETSVCVWKPMESFLKHEKYVQSEEERYSVLEWLQKMLKRLKEDVLNHLL